jgi:hypothetical protein
MSPQVSSTIPLLDNRAVDKSNLVRWSLYCKLLYFFSVLYIYLELTADLVTMSFLIFTYISCF